MRRELPLPESLTHLINSGLWRHPGHDVLRRVVPFILDPLCVLKNLDHMLFESGPLMGHDKLEDEVFSEYRGSSIEMRELPWIDVEKTIFIMCNERIGDDVGIALDYRHDRANPRVVGGDWHSGVNGIRYRQIAESFTDFATMLELEQPTT